MAKRSKRNTTHVYTSTRVEYDKVLFRVGNFFVLLSMFYADSHLELTIPETGYLLVLGAILGVDIPSLTRRFLKKF
jgi:hypothetical protein